MVNGKQINNTRKRKAEDYEEKFVNKRSNINNTIWKKLDRYIPPNNLKKRGRKDYFDWVSASKIKNYLMKDTILDWFDIQKKEFNVSNKISNEIITDKRALLFKKGHEFESKIFDFLEKKYKYNYYRVSKELSDITKENGELTQQLMIEGKPIIAQAVLYNYNNYTFGCADLIIRSDWINKLFEKSQITNDEINIPSPLLKRKYHYRVIDIKWSMLNLCADGIHIRNSDLMMAYKGQLAIYNCALGYIQGYIPNKSYILGKTWKFTQKKINHQGDNCFQLMGHIDYEDLNYDNKYIELTCNAIKWIRDIRYNGSNWSILPKPSVPELYPNMNNSYDEPYHNKKIEYASKLNELTMLWEVGHKHRSIGHKNGIYSWKDKKCNAENLGITGPVISPILNQIIKVNQSNRIKILPKYIEKCSGQWQKENKLDFYVDFETISDCLMKDNIDIFNSDNNSSVIFMIGVGYLENNEWKFRSFGMKNYSYKEEKRIILEFKNTIESLTLKYNKLTNVNNVPRLFHWSHAEKTFIESADNRHKHILFSWLSSIEWIDLYNIFRKEPIVVNGALTFSIKDIAKAMYMHGMIKTNWEDTIVSNGFNAMMTAVEYYYSISQKKKISDVDKYYMSSIEKYNEVDCKVMYEITDYLRKNHIKKNIKKNIKNHIKKNIKKHKYR